MKKHFKLLVMLLAVALLFTCKDSILANAANNNMIKVGVHGSFVMDAEKALERINEIRYEACKEGIVLENGKKLSLSDYVPIKWSSSLEEIAMQRAVEANVVVGHTRPNSESCFTVKASDGSGSWGEVLAWNYTKDMMMGIEQWYGEKYDLINHTGKVTGHYTQMIDPSHTYVGLGCFISDEAAWPNCTSGEYSSYAGESETPLKCKTNVIHEIEIPASKLQNVKLVIDSKNAGTTVKKGTKFNLVLKGNYSDKASVIFYCIDNVKWSSSNAKVIKINKNGTATAKKKGTATLKAKFNGVTYKLKIKVN